MKIHNEERVGSVIAGLGLIWTAAAVTMGLTDIWQFRLLPPGPLEICAIGILVWLHAKYRRSLRINQ
jgi:hypothetical protein